MTKRVKDQRLFGKERTSSSMATDWRRHAKSPKQSEKEKTGNMATDWPDALRRLTGYTWSSRPSPPQSRPTSCTRCASLPQPANESMKGMLLDFLTTINETGVTLPSLSVLQALITSFPEQNSSKQCCLLRSVTSLICKGERGLISIFNQHALWG